ncbi:uncharacterized protein LOC134202300 [Armigeres subalbatus]|uniref:uncharacterized protein LOC134202300 n=1 Tax=Armigeres subalbatus TaxID=124917 RepID=UPI002ED1F67F
MLDKHSQILENVSHHQASENTKYHALYAYYYLSKSRSELATLYCKHHSTISKWIREYEGQQSFRNGQSSRSRFHKLSEEEVEWIRQLYIEYPSTYLDEAKTLFEDTFRKKISLSTICRILTRIGFSRKVLEKRAVQIKDEDIDFFCSELQSLQWDTFNILFLDEVSFDNRDMNRDKGYGPIGKRVLNHGNHVRRARISLLCFLGIGGLLEASMTDGTFTRLKFFEACREFALRGPVHQYPGKNSIWILDGARIHTDANIVRYFRSLGIMFVFLPGYCPHFNPIEILFGLVKQRFKKEFNELKLKDLKLFVLEILMEYRNFDAKNLFRKCGYYPGGKFKP